MELAARIGNYVFPAILGPVLFVVLFSKEILALWISSSFAEHSATVLQWLAVGVLCSSIMRIPWTLLMAAHRPDVPAKLVLLEVPLYLSALYFAVSHFGITGAAVAWTGRMAFNCIALHLATLRVLPKSIKAVKKNSLLMLLSLSIVLIAAFLPQDIALKSLYFALACGSVGALIWYRLLSTEERAAIIPAWAYDRR
jgi:O-antigen/teichoic acid export membrane protein